MVRAVFSRQAFHGDSLWLVGNNGRISRLPLTELRRFSVDTGAFTHVCNEHREGLSMKQEKACPGGKGGERNRKPRRGTKNEGVVGGVMDKCGLAAQGTLDVLAMLRYPTE